MSTILRLTPAEYDQMIANGAFVGIDRRIELIHGELREMTPAGPLHEDVVDFLTRWSTEVTTAGECVIRIQSSIDLSDSRPEPDVTWLKPGRYARRRPQAGDVLLLIEVADSNSANDLTEKAALYAQAKIIEYWVVDPAQHGVHVFTDSDGQTFRQLRLFRSPEEIAPLYRPTAGLDLRELFAIN